jgi:formylglycine-generating enzyme required for sulfatase activity
MLEAVHAGTGLVFVLVPAGKYLRGSPETEEGSEADERPRVEVTVPAFLLSRTECTQRAWDAVGGEDSRDFPDSPDLPIQGVSWDATSAWCRKAGLRLPTEAEWEYACRAGSDGPWCFGDEEGRLKNFACFAANSRDEETGEERPCPVASRRHPNRWGLWDMHGNVWEWCRDTLHKDYADAPTDGSAWIVEGAKVRMRRGGGWSSKARACRSADRRGGRADAPDEATGFRPARSLP